jgi:hypothetical protein
MKKAIKILAWYSVILNSLNILVMPFLVNTTTLWSPGLVFLSSVLYAPIVAFGVLVLVYIRRQPPPNAPSGGRLCSKQVL